MVARDLKSLVGEALHPPFSLRPEGGRRPERRDSRALRADKKQGRAAGLIPRDSKSLATSVRPPGETSRSLPDTRSRQLAAGTMSTLRPRNCTIPSERANNVWSRPNPTRSPGR